MKCPKCGKEIKDGALFCEHCGAEIKIVPEYEPGLEDQISSGMEAVKQTLDPGSQTVLSEGNLSFSSEGNVSGGHLSGESVMPGSVMAGQSESDLDGGMPGIDPDSESVPLSEESEPVRSAEEVLAVKPDVDPATEEKAIRRQKRYQERRRHVRLAYLGIAALSGIAAVIVLYVVILGRERNSQSYYVGRAYQMASEGNYSAAADEIDRAISLTTGHDGGDLSLQADASNGSDAPVFIESIRSGGSGGGASTTDGSSGNNSDAPKDQTDATLYLLKAEYLQKAGEKDLALGAASRALESSQSTEDDKIAAYGRMISIYASDEQYAEIADLLDHCKYPSVVQSYLQYTLFDPVFSEEEGSYEGTLTLELSDEGDGSIFYTLDGSEPTTSSALYTEPIQLTDGEYIVSAVYVNHFGLQSNVVTKHYTIHGTMPAAPVVSPNSGTYAKETPITVHLPGTPDGKPPDDSGGIHYTTDGSDPTEEDPVYTEGLTIPAGTTTFKFVYISADGLRSEVVERTYTYKVSTNIGPEDGINYILVALIRRNEVVDTIGTIPGGTARYSFQYTGTQEIDGVRYLRYDESVTDSAGNTASTGRSYAVNAQNGTVNFYSDGSLVPIG